MIGLLFDPAAETQVRDTLLPLMADRPAQAVPYRCSALPEWPEGMIVLTCLGDGQLAELIPEAVARQWTIGLLPHPRLIQVRRCFGVTRRLDHALDDALMRVRSGALICCYCNDRPVFNSVAIGKSFLLDNASGPVPGFLARLQHFASILRSGFGGLRLDPYTLTTGKDKSLATAALSIAIVKESSASLLFRPVVNDTGSNDGMLHALVLAPRSRMELLRFLLAALFLGSGPRKAIS